MYAVPSLACCASFAWRPMALLAAYTGMLQSRSFLMKHPYQQIPAFSAISLYDYIAHAYMAVSLGHKTWGCNPGMYL